MNKLIIPMMVIILTVVTSIAMADQNGEAKVGTLFLFQKCDSNGCPTAPGPWPILPGTQTWGRLNYNLWGDKFTFSFTGRRLPSNTDYTLIYYPDPWPGTGLICLGSAKTNKAGNISINKRVDIGTNLPISTDANYTPAGSSGAVGAKIWLVPTDDVTCPISPAAGYMKNWNPAKYLFEYNLIVFEYHPAVPDDDDDEDEED